MKGSSQDIQKHTQKKEYGKEGEIWIATKSMQVFKQKFNTLIFLLDSRAVIKRSLIV